MWCQMLQGKYTKVQWLQEPHIRARLQMQTAS